MPVSDATGIPVNEGSMEIDADAEAEMISAVAEGACDTAAADAVSDAEAAETTGASSAYGSC